MRTARTIIALIFLTIPAFSWVSWNQLAELTASDGHPSDQLAESVAISGSTVVLGAPQAAVGSNNQEGSAYVYLKPANGWGNMTQVAKLTASDGQPAVHFGSSVAIDGDTIVVGEPFARIGNNGNQGALYVFVKPAGGWKDMTETAKLTASDGYVFDELGVSVAILGNTIVGSAPFATINSVGSAGAVYIFEKPKSGWKSSTQKAKLTPSDPRFGGEMGYGVSISGNTIAAGAPYYNQQGMGSAYVFVEPKSGWANKTQTAELTNSHGTPGDLLGFSVAINGDTVVAGGPNTNVGSNNQQGAACVWVKPAKGWKNMKQTAVLTSSDGAAGDLLGFAVSIAGNRIVAGANLAKIGSNFQQGAAYVYGKSRKGWKTTSKFSAKLTASDGTEFAYLGNAVHIVGNTILAGAPGQNSQQGAAYIFAH